LDCRCLPRFIFFQDGPHLSKTGKPLDREVIVDKAEGKGAAAKAGAKAGAAAAAKGATAAASVATSTVKGAKGHVHLAAHAVNVFLPLVDLTATNGGTEFYPGTHVWGRYDATTGRASPVVPLARAGDALLFDYRIKVAH
jgi:hypothetical protein